MRKLVITLLSLSLMAPAAALALGLGDIKLHSNLNQRLDADIELLSVDPAEVDDVTVSLASADTFSKMGLERPAVLMRVKFDVKRRANGKYYVKVTSRKVISEPFLDFLVEVKWPTGRVLREYTLLLDPPVSQRTASPVVTAPETGTKESAAVTPKQETATAEQEEEFVPPPSSIPVSPRAKAEQEKAEQEKMAKQKAPAPSAKPAKPSKPTKQAKPAQATKPAAPAKGIVYGPVKANDTLWAIALKLRPNKDISVQQMMLALQKANPYAFFDNNINRLKKGYVLRIDDPALLTAMNKAEAVRQVSKQTREWEDYRAAMAAKAKARQPVAEKQVSTPATGAAKSEPKLKLVAPEGEKQAGTSAEGTKANGDTNEKLMLALESSAAQRKENEELQSRVTELEEQLQDMQRLLTLKDADLAKLQKQLREQGQAATLPSDKQAGDMAKEAGGEMKKPEAAAEAMTEDKAMPQKAEGEVAKPEAAKPADKPEEKAAPAKPAAKPKPAPKPKPKVRPQPKPAPQPSFVESLLQDPIMLAAGGGTVVVLLILAMFLIRRRKKGSFQESILTGGTSSMLNAKEEDGAGETSFLSDLAISGMGGGTITTDEGEVDPLTEAEVFMAYGRNQQAEEVLKKSLESSPDRPEVIAKLLEVYHADKDKGKFDALAGESAEKLKANDDIWSKVVSMGHELSPENALFAGATATAAESQQPVAEEKSEPVSDDVLDIGLDLDELSAEMEGEGSEESFDLGLDLDQDEESTEEKVEATDEGLGDLDFDIGDFGAEEETSSATTAESEEEPSFDLDLGEESGAGEEPSFDLDIGEEAGTEEEPSFDLDIGEETGAEEEPSFDLNLGEEGGTEDDTAFDLDLGVEESATAAEESTDLGDMDLGDLDFGDLEFEGSAEGEAPSSAEEHDDLDLSALESDSDFGDLGDLEDEGGFSDSDEITTKLDLAQAYIEMGDNDGARSMLEEVVEGGNDEQKQQAQDLLSKI